MILDDFTKTGIKVTDFCLDLLPVGPLQSNLYK